MSEFYALQPAVSSVLDDFVQQLQTESNFHEQERQAAVRIQRVFRGHVVLARYRLVKNSTRTIQRLARGKLARIACSTVRSQRLKDANISFFHHSAQTVQRFWRGYWSRKCWHNFHARKAYLQGVRQAGERTVSHLEERHQQQLQKAAQDQANATRAEFGKLCGELHHLVSTRSVPGVYNPPYSDALPSAFGKPVEQHLRDETHLEVRSLRRPQKVRQHSATTWRPKQMEHAATHQPPEQTRFRSRTASVGRAQTIQGPFRSKHQIEVANAKAFNNFRSVQSESPYEAVKRDAQMQQRLEKLTRTAPHDFAFRRVEPSVVKPSVHAETQYRHRPLEFRDDYTDVPKMNSRPGFFTAVRQGNFID